MAEFIATLALVFVVCGIAYGCESTGCESKGRKMGFRGEYGLFEGCMIRVEGKWVPIESYRTLGSEP